MKKINVAIIHGIGNEKPGYSKELQDGIVRRFNKELVQILSKEDTYSEGLQFKEIVWADILGINQKRLKELLKKTETIRMSRKNLILVLLGRSMNWLRTSFAAESIGDIIGYKNPEGYKKIQGKIMDEINKFTIGEQKTNITFISHSLGTVIASELIYDRQSKEGRFHPGFEVHNFFTMGSPLALFSLQYDEAEFLKKPIRLEHTYGRWINFYDRHDPIAYKLKPLNEVYNETVLSDYEVDTGLLGAHISYWKNGHVHAVIAKKLATDWMAINGKLPQARCQGLYEKYDKEYAIA